MSHDHTSTADTARPPAAAQGGPPPSQPSANGHRNELTPQPAADNADHDLNLDQIVASVVAPKEPYRLLGYFRIPLDEIAALTYRQEIFQDLEHQRVFDVITDFSAGFRTMRFRLERVKKSHYHYQSNAGFSTP